MDCGQRQNSKLATNILRGSWNGLTTFLTTFLYTLLCIPVPYAVRKDKDTKNAIHNYKVVDCMTAVLTLILSFL